MSSRSDSLSANVDIPNLPKDTPPEMIPILTLLHAHQSRDYFDGYFMLLNDLNTGKCFCYSHSSMNCFWGLAVDDDDQLRDFGATFYGL